ncbi:DUF1281 domain-containing protein [Rouxiella badensis]|uniref:DUF1281 domain-containing protein n=1 Tax=Rouxiella badensis TaxID=1646377 RepID=UPI001D14CCA9|nr:DUF1281 domain-containing protein [Rouxiella badensis]MCC3705155.1 DUF1281 domain-containing protein [Rouxiella badensis]
MSDWCTNRLVVTGQSAFVDELQLWVIGNIVPRYRHAVLQSRRLFLAGAAGILKPIKPVVYPPYPGLLANGTGASSPQNQAFENWLGLLQKDVYLTVDNVRQVERWYRQSGIEAVKWENIPFTAQMKIADIFQRKYADWFGMVGVNDFLDAGVCWSELAIVADNSLPCDLMTIIPSRLAAEINGSEAFLKGIPNSTSLYYRHYGTQWPAGQRVSFVRDCSNSLTVHFDTFGDPLTGEVMAALSALYSCQIQHAWLVAETGKSGYDCFDGGVHVNSANVSPATQDGEVIYLNSAKSSGISPEIRSTINQ